MYLFYIFLSKFHCEYTLFSETNKTKKCRFLTNPGRFCGTSAVWKLN